MILFKPKDERTGKRIQTTFNIVVANFLQQFDLIFRKISHARNNSPENIQTTIFLECVAGFAAWNEVDPEIPYFLEHANWFKPYVAGFYASKYEGRNITRDEAMKRLDELLAYELRTTT